LGLVEYIGRRNAYFTLAIKVGENRAKERRWSSQPTQKRRWLPEAEALEYAKKRDFRVTRWGGRARVSPPVRAALPSLAIAPFDAPAPEENAVHITALMEARKATEDVIREIKVEDAEKTGEDLPQFVLSRSGMAHRRGCSSQPKTGTWAFTLEEVSRLPAFKRYHSRCIEKA